MPAKSKAVLSSRRMSEAAHARVAPDAIEPVRRKSAPRPAPYKIADLERLSGASRETIRYYLNEGLLPPPIRSARNMAWYSERHLEALQVVQTLRRERFLPLRAIRTLVTGSDEPLFTDAQRAMLAEMKARLHAGELGPARTGRSAPARRAAKSPRTGSPLAAPAAGSKPSLSRKERVALFDVLAFDPTSSADTAHAIEAAWTAIRQAGLTARRGFKPADLAFLARAVDGVVEAELEIFRHRIPSLGHHPAAGLVEAVVPNLSRLFQLVHEWRVARLVEQLAQR